MFEELAIPVAEDSVEYHVYFGDPTRLPELAHACIAYSKSLIGDYMWQEEPFHLSLTHDTMPHLWGATRFGDNIEDEWLIVHILIQLSKQFSSEDVWISVSDSDGQFLLIEAALVLPSWITPDNRVWISKGSIHIIPLPRSPMEMILLPSALSILRSQVVETIAPPAVQDAIQQRVQVSVEQSKVSTHWAYCWIPKSIGYILQKRPELVSHAVTSYYHRDPIQMRACKKLSKFSDTEFSVTPVRFSRILYAQILRQPLDFVPQGLVKLPKEDDRPLPTSSTTTAVNAAPTRKQMEIGYKLLCGFEILYNERKKAFDRRKRTKQQQRKMREQREAKRGNTSYNEDEEEEDFVDPSQAIDEILGDPSDLTHPWRNFKPTTNITQSPDHWLNISPDEVDDLITKKQREFQEYEKARAEKKEKGGKKMEDPLEEMVSEMKKFVSKVSDYTGVEVDGDGAEEDEENMKEDFDLNIKKFVEIMYGGKFAQNDDSGSRSDDEADEFYGMGTDEEDDDDDDGEGDDEGAALKEVMEMMDEELKGTTMGRSFEKMRTADKEAETEDVDAPVDINLNLVENFLKSFEAQHGTAGPVSNVLGQLKGNK